MDDIVRQAMAKWPNVPDCYGWLGLDTRGNWYMRDDRAQSLGPFAGGVAGAKGSLLQHDKLIAFINRNYLADEQGRWFFQNGPQRVYVELAATPWIWRVQGRSVRVSLIPPGPWPWNAFDIGPTARWTAICRSCLAWGKTLRCARGSVPLEKTAWAKPVHAFQLVACFARGKKP